MKALLDTNIIIHRESNRILSQDIGILYRWLDKAKYTKCIHSSTISEINKNSNKKTVEVFSVKLDSYEIIEIPSPLHHDIIQISEKFDVNNNDKIDTALLNEVYVGRVDILISEDKKIHKKATSLNIQNKVFTIDSFLEKITSERPELIDYKILNVRKNKFGKINLKDPFFDSLKEDYVNFEQWFIRKFDEEAYITFNSKNQRLLSFLYLKIENIDEIYSDITPTFPPKKRLKVGTFKVINNGFRLGERFMKIIFDNALRNQVKEIYVTIFDKREEQKRLIQLIEQWGFIYWGMKGQEKVYVRNFLPSFNSKEIKKYYPYVSSNNDIYIVPIYPEYHTELLPDSILNTESPTDFIENRPHRNCIQKVYVSRAIPPHPKNGDILIFYRTGGYYKSVITTMGIVDEVRYNFQDQQDFLNYCRKTSVYPEKKLIEMWNYSDKKPFVIRFLSVYSFPHRINMQHLIDLGVLSGVDDAPRGFKRITKEQLNLILKETKSDDSFIID